MSFTLVVIVISMAIWGFEPVRTSRQRLLLGVVCFLAAAGASSFALQADRAAWQSVLLIVVAAAAGVGLGVALRQARRPQRDAD